MENITQGQWFSGPASILGDPIDQSLRFVDSNSPRLTRTFAQNHSSNSSTVSYWLKRGKLGTLQTIGCMDNGQNELFGRFTTDDQYSVVASSGGHTTTRRFRDTSAWYHIFINQTTLYINGELQHTGTLINGITTKDKWNIGQYGANLTQYFDGYLAEFHFIDGTNKAHTDFGKFNSDGVWVPIEYTGSYGTNGFHLTFDSTQTNGIGHDSSGNGNHFTASNFDTSAISSSNKSHDIDIDDTPTTNWATGNSAHKTGTLNFGNLGFKNISSTRCKTSGSILLPKTGVWQVEYLATTGYQTHLGFMLSNINYVSSTDYGAGHWRIVNNNWFINDGTTESGAVPSTSDGDVWTMIYDRDNDNCKWYRNNTLEYTLDPLPSVNNDYVVNVQNYGNANEYNFGQYAFQHTPNANAKPLNTANLPEPAIKNGKDHFEVLTYTGNSTDDRDVTGLNFQPDLLFIKNTNTTSGWTLVDSVRGATKRLLPNASDAEATTTNYVKAFNSDGFRVGTADNVNGNNHTLLAYAFKGGGAAVSKTTGTINSNVSANTDAGFSIVSYTGNGTSGATIEHGLSSAPEFMIVRNRDDAEAFAVYHKGVDRTAPEDYWMRLDTASVRTDSTTHWNDTAPGTTVFTVGNANATNGNGDAIIAYCWHGVDGFSKFGYYDGNGSTDGPFVYLGFKPALIWLKKTAGGNDWHAFDNVMPDNTANPCEDVLNPNTTGGVGAFGAGIDIVSNGFKLRSSNTVINNSGNEFLYMAWAEHPFGGANTPPVTAR